MPLAERRKPSLDRETMRVRRLLVGKPPVRSFYSLSFCRPVELTDDNRKGMPRTIGMTCLPMRADSLRARRQRTAA